MSRTLDDDSRSRDRRHAERQARSRQVVDGAQPRRRRRGRSRTAARETRTTLQNGAPLLTDFGDNIGGVDRASPLYAQDEWSLTPNWAAHAGLRWEGIRTRGSGEDGQPEATNRSSVWTPLLHAVWKPDPKGRDQVRISLTRSYRSPPLGNLIARPSVNTRYPVPGPEHADAARPRRQPRPEARARDRHRRRGRALPAGSGVLSANVFRRSISDYMRSVTTLETRAVGHARRATCRARRTSATR